MIHVVSYDLRKPNRNYSELIAKLKVAGSSWCKPLESFWLIESEASSSQLRDFIQPFIDADDSLMVIRTFKDAAWSNLAPECSRWINDPARRW